MHAVSAYLRASPLSRSRLNQQPRGSAARVGVGRVAVNQNEDHAALDESEDLSREDIGITVRILCKFLS